MEPTYWYMTDHEGKPALMERQGDKWVKVDPPNLPVRSLRTSIPLASRRSAADKHTVAVGALGTRVGKDGDREKERKMNVLVFVVGAIVGFFGGLFLLWVWIVKNWPRG